ncbi:DUF6580 family putative transport protein [Gracilimonas mengyeensis]|uniref:Uncharacterized protein n=1 Tax=Gracilimonas mengyeensis TaxID=1302730 RepID=A0A521F9Z8_9BACT|nr:DUF6580 family putative transport protein [Gracilimonas mengyeensis]SMO92966.1 hypothetical protein SAMN06265219_11644 [Gracilimonas mengyeensis]
MKNKRFLVLSGFIVIAALSRIVPHPYNFAPIGAMSIFGAAYFTDKKFSFLLPLAAMFVSDLLVNNLLYANFYGGFVLFTPGFWWMYGSIALIVLAGIFILKKVNTKTVIAGSLSASIIFFLVTNFGAWLGNPIYPQGLEGLFMSYAAGIPFFHYTVLGDLVYSGVMFGAFEYARSKTPALQTVSTR